MERDEWWHRLGWVRRWQQWRWRRERQLVSHPVSRYLPLVESTMDKEFRELVSRLKSAVPHNLAAVIVHGSAVLSQGNHATTDYQVLIVTKTLAASDLRAMRSTVQWWTFSGYSMPTFFTSKEFIDSLDVFSVEL